MPSHARAGTHALPRPPRAAAPLAELLAREAGKPITLARLGVDRALFVLEIAAEEVSACGECCRSTCCPRARALGARPPLSARAHQRHHVQLPLLLSIHKLAPAVACGATLSAQAAATRTALPVMALGGCWPVQLPEGALGLVPCTVEDAAPLIDDPRVRMLTFTGSAAVGWALRRRAGNRKVALELGGNAAVVVEPDADLAHAVTRCVAGGFGYAGQSCISVQRILVHEDVADDFTRRGGGGARARAGDPLDPATELGPMIDEPSAPRVAGWIDEAVAAGAQLATGGTRAAPSRPACCSGAPRERR
jgi:glyceraldehyde-3-phosphate dehydrogenase (NADP+)